MIHNKICRLWCLLSVVFFLSLYSNTFSMPETDTVKCLEKVENLLKMLGKDLYLLEDEFSGYTFRDTVLEDEGVTWNAKIAFRNDEPLFIAEANWLDSIHISRIAILSRSVCTRNLIRLEDTFKDLRNYVSTKIPSVPDGYFLLRDKEDKRISYWFCIGKYQELFESLSDFSKIPLDITIESILIQEQNQD